MDELADEVETPARQDSACVPAVAFFLVRYVLLRVWFIVDSEGQSRECWGCNSKDGMVLRLQHLIAFGSIGISGENGN